MRAYRQTWAGRQAHHQKDSLLTKNAQRKKEKKTTTKKKKKKKEETVKSNKDTIRFTPNLMPNAAATLV